MDLTCLRFFYDYSWYVTHFDCPVQTVNLSNNEIQHT